MSFYKWDKTAANNATADTTVNAREGMAPSQVNDSMRAMMAAIAKERDDQSGSLTTAGTSTAYTVTTNQVFASLVTGYSITITPHTTSGAAPTLNVDGLGAKSIRTVSGTALDSGFLIAGTPYRVTYNSSTNEWLVNNITANPYVIPIGGIMDFVSSTPPNSSFALPYGQAVSRTTYATLFALVSTTFGAGDGSTTFNLPDLRGRVRVGKDNMGGSTASRVTSARSGIAGTTLGATGGDEAQTIAKANLPNYALPDTFSISGTQTGGLARALNVPTTTGQFGSGITPAQGVTFATTTLNLAGSVTLGGSGTELAIMPPSIVLTQLIRVI